MKRKKRQRHTPRDLGRTTRGALSDDVDALVEALFPEWTPAERLTLMSGFLRMTRDELFLLRSALRSVARK